MNKSDSILVVNAGSSSLKFSLFRIDRFGDLQLAARGAIDGVGTRPRLKAKDADGAPLVERNYQITELASVPDAIALAGAWLREQFPDETLRAVGHRVVHGGTDYARPVRVDDLVFAAL